MLTLIKAGGSANNYKTSIAGLLQTEKLPVDDLPADLNNFIVAFEDERLVGSIGLEIHGTYGLLRSLVVDKNYRGKGIADQLMHELEARGRELKLQSFYLLTETAPGYFLKRGYMQVDRSSIPGIVQQSSEFSHVCPQSAIAMMKTL
jgi:amino-acid N-acetyltransferase